MKKAMLGFVAIGALFGSRPAARRIGRKMREHCGQMAAQCKQLAGQFGTHGESIGRT